MGNQGEIAISHGSIATNNIEMGDFDSAFENLDAAYNIFNEINDTRMCAMVNSYIAAMYLDKKDYFNVINYVDKSIDVFEQLKDIPNLTKNLLYKAKALCSLNDYDMSLELTKKSIKYAQEICDSKALFQSNLLSIEIEYSMDSINRALALKKIDDLIVDYKDDEDLADAYFLINYIENSDKNRKHVLKLYQDLYDNIPRYKYMDKINFLSEE